MTEADVPRLELRDITKIYPSVVANDGVSLSVMPGEIHAVLGENGAGKSTLMKIIYGVVKADSGTIAWNDEPVSVANPAHARRLGMLDTHFVNATGLPDPDHLTTARDLATLSRALSRRSRFLFVSSCQEQSLSPKVMGSAWTLWVLPAMGVFLYLRACFLRAERSFLVSAMRRSADSFSIRARAVSTTLPDRWEASRARRYQSTA